MASVAQESSRRDCYRWWVSKLTKTCLIVATFCSLFALQFRYKNFLSNRTDVINWASTCAFSIPHTLIQSVGLNCTLEYSTHSNWPCNIWVVKLIDHTRTIWGNTVIHNLKQQAILVHSTVLLLQNHKPKWATLPISF